MKNLYVQNKIITAVLTGGILLSCSGFTLAASSSGVSSTKPATTKTQYKLQAYKHGCGNGREILETTLKESVSSKLITQQESDKVTAYFNSLENKNNTPRADPFKELVSKGILTQQKSDAIKANMKNKFITMRNQNIQNQLNALVSNKTLTKEQASKIQEAIQSKYMDPLKPLVDDKTISQKQANEVHKALHARKHCKK